MFNEPKQWHWVLPALGGVGLWSAGEQLAAGGEAWLACMLGTVILGLAASVSLAWVVLYRWSILVKEYRQAMATTPEGELARELRGLPAEAQSFLLERFKLSIERHIRQDGRAVERLGPTGVPVEGVAVEYLPRCSGTSVCPTRSFTEGSLNRQYCEAVTKYLQELGLVLGFNGGNEAAKWAPGVAPAFMWGELGYSLETSGEVM